MGILINKNTKVVVQGITGREGSVRTKYMKSYGTHVVGGTSPGKKGSDVHGVPVYNTVKEIAREHGEIDFSVIFVPGHVLKTAVMEAADAGVKNVIPCVEGTPIHDIMEMIAYCKAKGTRLLGPGSIGIITPGEAVVGWLGGNPLPTQNATPTEHGPIPSSKEGPSACSRAAAASREPSRGCSAKAASA